jgi:hypothetical protein
MTKEKMLFMGVALVGWFLGYWARATFHPENKTAPVEEPEPIKFLGSAERSWWFSVFVAVAGSDNCDDWDTAADWADQAVTMMRTRMEGHEAK